MPRLNLTKSEKRKIRNLQKSDNLSGWGTKVWDTECLDKNQLPSYSLQEQTITHDYTTGGYQFPEEIADENDDIKRVWFCMDDRDNRGWNLDEDTFNRFSLLHAGIERLIPGTDEELVWTALSGGNPEEQKTGAPKGRIENDQLKKMLPILSCMKTDKPWEQDYTTENDLDGKNVYGWIMADFSGAEACYLKAYLEGKGRGDCDQKHNYFWWDKAANWIKELF